MKLKQLVEYCHHYLEVDQFKDYCPNGLQVEGSEDVRLIVTGVTACEALIDRAIDLNAQAVLVHHGYFWKGEAQPIIGLKGNRIKKLIKNDMSLLAYHLPLDAHQIVGNNAQLKKQFGASIKGSFYNYNGHDIALYGELERQQTVEEFSAKIGVKLGREVMLIKGDERPVKTIGWCSGGAQGGFGEAINLGVDAYISGEISENTFHLAKESGVHYLSAGHHATEKGGVQALGAHLANEFKVQVQFVDIANPV